MASKRLTKLEREAIQEVVIETLAGDAFGFFKDSCGETEERANELAAALESASVKL